MKFLLVLILFLIPNVSFSKNVTSETFNFTKVYDCGPKKYEGSAIKEVDLNHYYFIHFNDNDNVVILHDQHQFELA